MTAEECVSWIRMLVEERSRDINLVQVGAMRAKSEEVIAFIQTLGTANCILSFTNLSPGKASAIMTAAQKIGV